MLTKYYDSTPVNLFDAFRIFDDLYTLPTVKTRTSSAYRVNSTENGLDLSIDLPGVKSKDLSVQLSGRDIKVSGMIRDNNFSYSYRLSKDYDPATVEATLEDGVLSLNFQKNSEAAIKTIDVKVK